MKQRPGAPRAAMCRRQSEGLGKGLALDVDGPRTGLDHFCEAKLVGSPFHTGHLLTNEVSTETHRKFLFCAMGQNFASSDFKSLQGGEDPKCRPRDLLYLL